VKKIEKMRKQTIITPPILTSQHKMSSIVSGLMELRNMIDRVIEASGSAKDTQKNLKLTKSGKPRKISDKKGQPTARNAFEKMICEDMKSELEAFKATLPKKQGAQFTFVANYKKENPEAYPAFQAKWKAEQATTVSESASIKTDSTIVAETPGAVAQVVMQIENKIVKKPVKTAKKAIVTEIAAPIDSAVTEELLPFTFNGGTYLRPGTRRENGNHLWSSGHLWMSKKGAKGHHYGEIQEDGSINMDADEPSF
jgi:hypothetical protein